VSATPAQIERPSTEDELRSVVSGAAERGDTVRVAGSGHSFSPVVPSDDTLISLEQYTGVVSVDPDAQTVTVKAGTTLADIGAELANHGLAMENLGDIDSQTIAGALSTGTHGTGLDFGVLATQIAAIRLVTADGEIRELSLDDDQAAFRAGQVSLGTMGVISELTLDVEPAYDLVLRRRALPLEDVLDSIEEFHDAHRQWEFFWFPHTDTALVKTFDEVPRDAEQQVAASSGDPVDDTIEQLGAKVENAAWEWLCKLGTDHPGIAPYASQVAAMTLSDKTEVGPSYEVYANPREVRFHETEYGLPATDLPAALQDVRDYIEGSDVPVQFPVECRFVGDDEPLLSPAHGRDSCFIAVHTYYKKDMPEYFETCEGIFDQYDGRPHWGKHHTKTASELASLYPEWDQFQEIRREFDPDGLFLNEHMRDVFGVE
jgi:FAD-linked oxidoreductase